MNRLLRLVVLSSMVWAVALPAVVLAAEAAPIPFDEQGLPLWEIRQWQDFPVSIALPDQAALANLLAQVPLADFHREDWQPTADGWQLGTRITNAEATALTQAGFDFDRLADLEQAGRRAVEQAWAEAAGRSRVLAKDNSAALDYYPTNVEIGQILDDLATRFPEICRTFTWGESVLGRPLHGLVISADVQNTAAEPEVRLSSNIHGNEVLGMIMLLDLASHLATNYGQVGYDDLTDLVNTTEIHFMPMHNPDGYVAGSRTNANYLDLNRNFPLPTGYATVQEPETAHYMTYANAHHFVISQNGHGGALVVNYPWDHTYDLAPDDAALAKLSLEYSTYNLPMYNGRFDQGITSGAAWYRVDGGMQDWVYDQTDCMDVTVELGVVKWPATTDLARYWDENRESLLHFSAAAHYGIHGVVTDALSGEPLAAQVTVTGNVMSVGTDPAHGDYYKLLDSGDYELTFAAEGYQSQTVSGVSTTWGAAAELNVSLLPAQLPLQLAVTAWPNPFNPSVTVAIEVQPSGPVLLEVFDLRGRLVRTLPMETLSEGKYQALWEGDNNRGTHVGSGVYFVRASTGSRATTVKVIMAR